MLDAHPHFRIQADKAWLDAQLMRAEEGSGLVILANPHLANLAHSRDAHAARLLREGGLHTLQLNLLSDYEDQRDPDLRYDITRLDRRLRAVIAWIRQQPALGELPLCVLATDTVAAAAIRLLAREPELALALVCRAGRPELAGANPLRNLSVPTLFQQPGADASRNGAAPQVSRLLNGPHRWHEHASASAGYIEPGTLDSAMREACRWFLQHLAPTA